MSAYHFVLIVSLLIPSGTSKTLAMSYDPLPGEAVSNRKPLPEWARSGKDRRIKGLS